ncbi:MAG: hypothetical protein ACREQY_12215, partial [Candidatus Binatia bacterium]
MDFSAYGKRIAVIALVGLITWTLAAPLQFRDWHSPRVGTPEDHGLRFEPVEFRPPDQPITLRAWWIPAARPKAAVVMVHGGGD